MYTDMTGFPIVSSHPVVLVSVRRQLGGFCARQESLPL